MKLFYNLKIGYKLALGFGVCLLLASAMAAVAIERLAEQSALTKTLISDTVVGLKDLATFNASARRFRTLEFQRAISTNSSDIEADEEALTDTRNSASNALSDYSSSALDPVDAKNAQNLTDSWNAYLTTHDNQEVPLIQSNHIQDAEALLNSSMTVGFHAATDQLNQMLDWNVKHANWYSRREDDLYRTASSNVLCMLALAILIGGAFGAFITRYVTKTVKQVSGSLKLMSTVCLNNLGLAVEALEQGDLTFPIVTATEPLIVQSTDEFGQMVETFNTMLGRTHSTIASFRSSQSSLSDLVKQLQTAANHVGSAAVSLAGTSQEIGAATEEISSTMEEVTQASEQSARGAGEVASGSASQAASISQGAELVRQLAEAVRNVATDSESTERSVVEASESAQVGAASVRETVAGMQSIQRNFAESSVVIQALEESSKQIGSIVETIENIADQTNLLALNAAIEAARAGDSGRGFAVVADEVRKLAERSRSATKEISDLIDGVQLQTSRAISVMDSGVKAVAENATLAERAGESLIQIQTSVALVTERVHNICAASEEMTAASDEVSRSISDIAIVVEQSSAAAEEVSASAEEVSASVATVAATTTQQATSVAELVSAAADLASIAKTLTSLTEQFKVGNEQPESMQVRSNLIAPKRESIGAKLAGSLKRAA